MKFKYILSFCSLFIFLSSCENENPAFVVPDFFEFSMDLNGYFDLKEDQSSEKKRRMVWNDGKSYLSINSRQLDSTGHANKILKDKRFLIESLFKEQPHPYPGIVSNRKECPKEFQPIILEKAYGDSWMFSYQMFANDRFVYGGCTKEANFFNSVYVFLYCSSKNVLYEFKYFTPMENPSADLVKLIESVRCK